MEMKEIRNEDALYQKARALRHALFFEEHRLPRTILDDDKELQSTHIALLEDDTLVGYGRLTRLNKTTFQISQMVIAPERQSHGYGTALLKDLMQRATNAGADSIVLNARTNATGFYAKQHFVPQGEIFPSNSTGIPHIRMCYRRPESACGS